MKKIIVTIGPALMKNLENIKKYSDNYIFRINGAHGNESSITEYINQLQQNFNDPQVLIDLPGNKIRTTNLGDGINFGIGSLISINANQTNYPKFIQFLSKDTIIWANDSTFKFIVHEVHNDKVILKSESEGKLIDNKGLHVRNMHAALPFLFDKDFQLINIANKFNVQYVGLSFVRNAKDIQTAMELLDKKITIIAKVETKSAVANLNEILKLVDHILIDRGDLSTEVGLEKIPAYQKYIIEKALFFNKRVFLATQFLKHMEDNPIPTIAEVVDLYNTFKMGVYGIQLSEETAVGKYPVKCLEIARQILKEVHDETQYS